MALDRCTSVLLIYNFCYLILVNLKQIGRNAIAQKFAFWGSGNNIVFYLQQTRLQMGLNLCVYVLQISQAKLGFDMGK